MKYLMFCGIGFYFQTIVLLRAKRLGNKQPVQHPKEFKTITDTIDECSFVQLKLTALMTSNRHVIERKHLV